MTPVPAWPRRASLCPSPLPARPRRRGDRIHRRRQRAAAIAEHPVLKVATTARPALLVRGHHAGNSTARRATGRGAVRRPDVGNRKKRGDRCPRDRRSIAFGRRGRGPRRSFCWGSWPSRLRRGSRTPGRLRDRRLTVLTQPIVVWIACDPPSRMDA